MEIALDILVIILGIVGILGAVLPVLPGPPISYVGMGLLYFWGSGAREVLTPRLMIVWLVIATAVTILDYIIPSYVTKVSGGSKAASRGTFIGMIIGIIFFPPIGMIIGSFLGALLAEMIIEGKELKHSLKSAIASFIGFLLGTGLKLIASGVMMYYIIIAAFN